jgi:ribosomal protein L37E
MSRKNTIAARSFDGFYFARKAYCTGCGVTFGKTHELINHRRTHRCGGRFLSQPERKFVDKLRFAREDQDRQLRLCNWISKHLK